MKAQLAPKPVIAHCFPSGTAVLTVNGPASIDSLVPGDLVLSFDPSADFGRGALVPKRLVRLFHNETEEWLRLSWREGGEERELTVTPGHRFLDAEGRFRRIDEIIEDAAPTVVLADGSLAQVRAERIVWSEATRHLFEVVETVAMAAGAALVPRRAGRAKSGQGFNGHDGTPFRHAHHVLGSADPEV